MKNRFPPLASDLSGIKEFHHRGTEKTTIVFDNVNRALPTLQKNWTGYVRMAVPGK